MTPHKVLRKGIKHYQNLPDIYHQSNESKSYSFEVKVQGVFMVFGDSDVQNGAILEHLSGLNVHYGAACVSWEPHSMMKADSSNIELMYSSE